MPPSSYSNATNKPFGAGPFRVENGKTGCLMVHGFTGTPWVFHGLAEALARKGISVSAPLLPGHGTRPEKLIGIQWEEWVDAVRQEYHFLRGRCEDMFFLGLSMGGSIALMLASEYPVQGIISLSAPVRFDNWWAVLLPYLKPFKRYWKKRHQPDCVEAGYDRYPLDAVSEMLDFLNKVREKLPQITCPALIMHAYGDQTVSSVNADRIFNCISSKVKKKVFLEHPCHVITKGEDAHTVYNEVSLFIRSNCSLA